MVTRGNAKCATMVAITLAVVGCGPTEASHERPSTKLGAPPPFAQTTKSFSYDEAKVRRVAGSATARAEIAALRAQFQIDQPLPAALARGLHPQVARIVRRPVIADSQAEGFTSQGAWLRPLEGQHWRNGVKYPAQVWLPVRASGSLLIRDVKSGIWVSISLNGARPVEARVADGLVWYGGATLQGGDVVIRVTAEGAEDFVVFDRPPPQAQLAYRLHLSKKVAGLRLVQNVLEFVDAGGAPRLRMAPPWLIDVRGKRQQANVALSGCRYDDDPAGPWNRPVTHPQSGYCELVVTWVSDRLSYPALLDPAWTTTGSMITGRSEHRANVLLDGKVLVTGNSTADDTAELYEPTSGTWASTGNLSGQRRFHTASVLANGKVLLTGGQDDAYTDLNTTDVYEPTQGTWSPGPLMSTGHSYHTASVLANGKVLIAGGGWPLVSIAELYDPALESWTTTGSMVTARQSHSAAVLADGRVLVVAGTASQSIPELYDPNTGTWTDTADPATILEGCLATLLDDGRVLVTGTYTGLIYNPSTNTWTTTGILNIPRGGFTVSRLADGKVLAAGGSFLGELDSVELFDPVSGDWMSVSNMSEARAYHTASLLFDGRLLVAGGLDSTSSLMSSELFERLLLGDSCVEAHDCVSGFCADGVCCNNQCDEICHGCTALVKGQGADGECGVVKSGTDPRDDCTDDGSPLCGLNGYCDGTGSCQNYSVNVGCTPNPCVEDAQCTSRFCVDGICCDTACSAECRACTLEKKGSGPDGECGNVDADTDPDDECAIDPNFPLTCLADGFCDGAGQCRHYAKSDVLCGASTCATGIQSAFSCNGGGQCLPSTIICEPYVCDASGGSCLSSCGSDLDCASGYQCQTGVCVAAVVVCVDGHTLQNSDGNQVECAPYVCANGICKNQCSSVDDCVSPYVCDDSNHCVSFAADTAEGCSCRTTGTNQPSNRLWVSLWLLVGAFGYRRFSRKAR